uniref:EGF-like domain-containing protein n=1 Tax=Romanomermis culicivorax TaxID=13658 RepID=A0A915JI26_ROMCU
MKFRPIGNFWAYFFIFILLFQKSVQFTLEGSPESYARFPKWHHLFENVLSFEFHTDRDDGLLLYTDDGGSNNFYEIRLIEGRILRLTFKIGRRNHHPRHSGHYNAHCCINRYAQNARRPPIADHPNILEINADQTSRFSDNTWRKVELFQFWEKIKLTVDGRLSTFLTLGQQDFVFGNYETNSDVFLGGLPPNWPDAKLSYKGVRNVARLAGSVRNLVYRTLPHGVTAPLVLDVRGVRDSDDDHCEQFRCSNKAQCYNTDDGPKCDCGLDFEGHKCQI